MLSTANASSVRCGVFHSALTHLHRGADEDEITATKSELREDNGYVDHLAAGGTHPELADIAETNGLSATLARDPFNALQQHEHT